MYQEELRSIAERAEIDKELTIALTIRVLLGILNAPKFIQNRFVNTLGTFAQATLDELNKIKNSKLN